MPPNVPSTNALLAGRHRRTATPHRASGQPTNGSTPTQGATPTAQAQITTAQTQLAAHGFEPGVRHGQMDYATRTQVQKFQTAKGLAVTGKIDGPTNTALNAPVGSSIQGSRPGKAFRSRPTSVGGGTSPMPPIQHAGGSSATGAGARPSRSSSQGVPMPAGTQKVQSIGFRAALLFSATLAAAASAIQVVSKPQKTFRGENVVIDPTLVGPFCNVTMPTVGSDVQIIGGGNSTTVPGTIFAPNQNGALDFEMYIAEQGNDVSFNVTNNQATLPLSFAAAIFGVQVQAVPGGQAPQGGMAGVLVPGSYS